MKALVTGSTGFVGAAVTRCLLERGVDVRVLVRRDSDLRNLEGLKVEQAYGDLRDVAAGHRLDMEKGRIGERYIIGNRNLMLREVLVILSRLTGVPAPTIKLPRWSILPLAYANQWLADYVTHRPPRIPLEGVKMAKYVMHYDWSKAMRELGLPQTPVEVALEKAVRWFRDHHYA